MAQNRNTIRAALVKLIAETGINDWDKAVHKLKGMSGEAPMQTYRNRANRLAEGLLLFSSYLNFRGATGCGDHGHEAALEGAQKALKKIRRAMGYTYP